MRAARAVTALSRFSLACRAVLNRERTGKNGPPSAVSAAQMRVILGDCARLLTRGDERGNRNGTGKEIGLNRGGTGGGDAITETGACAGSQLQWVSRAANCAWLSPALPRRETDVAMVQGGGMRDARQGTLSGGRRRLPARRPLPHGPPFRQEIRPFRLAKGLELSRVDERVMLSRLIEAASSGRGRRHRERREAQGKFKFGVLEPGALGDGPLSGAL